MGHGRPYLSVLIVSVLVSGTALRSNEVIAESSADQSLHDPVGLTTSQNLLATETPIAKLRGKVHTFGARSWPVVVTYHPAYLLRSPGEKRKSWQDLLHAKQLFNRLQQERGDGVPA